MKCQSVYDVMKPYIDFYPIFNVDKNGFMLVPYAMNGTCFLNKNVSLEFNIVRSYDSCEIISLNTWRKVSNKAKFFLFQHFTNLKNYTEYMYLEDRHISIIIEI